MTAVEWSPWELLTILGDRGWAVAVTAEADEQTGEATGNVLLLAERGGIPLQVAAPTVALGASELYEQAQRVGFAGV